MASNSNSGQKFISRNRKPRVHITYEDPYDAEKLVELPFVMGVLADLSGNASDVDKPDMNDRKFLDIDMDNFDKRMAAIEPAVSMRVPNKLGADEGSEKLGVNLKFTSMDDFSPAAIARQVPAMAKLLAAREQLANLLKYMDGKAAAEETLKKLLADPQLMAAMKAKLDQRAVGTTAPLNKGFGHGHGTARAESAERRNGAGRSGRVLDAPQAELQTANGARGERSRKRGASACHPGARRLERRQGRGARHDRGDDRAARREAFGADERSAARARIPAVGERVARTELSRLQLRDRRDAQDPRA